MKLERENDFTHAFITVFEHYQWTANGLLYYCNVTNISPPQALTTLSSSLQATFPNLKFHRHTPQERTSKNKKGEI